MAFAYCKHALVVRNNSHVFLRLANRCVTENYLDQITDSTDVVSTAWDASLSV